MSATNESSTGQTTTDRPITDRPITDQNDWRGAYDFASHTLSLDGHRYHYLDEGQGQPLLMVHGNPTWSFYWRGLVRALRGRYRAVAVDHMGCGLSDKPADYPYCLQQHIDNLVALIRQLDLRDITLLVHDWGGAIGLGAALEVPDRVTRLVLFNTGAFPPPYIPLRIRMCRIPVLGTLGMRGLNLFSRAALTMATAQPAGLTRQVRAGLLAPYDSWAHRVAVDRFVKDIPASPRHPTWAVLERIEQGLSSLASRPVAVCWGMRDWCFTDVCLKKFERLFPDAEVHRFEDAGHYVVEDAGERIIPILEEFLAGHPLDETASRRGPDRVEETKDNE